MQFLIYLFIQQTFTELIPHFEHWGLKGEQERQDPYYHRSYLL